MSRLPLISIAHNQSIEPGALAAVPSEYLRGIDTYYHLEMIAETREELSQYFVSTLINGTRLAGRTLSGYSGGLGMSGGNMSDSMVPNALLTFVTQLMSGLRPLMERGNNLTTQSSPAEVTAGLQTSVLESCERFTNRVLRNQGSLLASADKLERIYDPTAINLRREATTAFTEALSLTGKDREEHLDMAMRLLRVCVENPNGQQDYSAWFQIGWILWKAGSLAEAEEAFFRAKRLSATAKDVYSVKSSEHVAYMQYLQGRFEDAFTSAQAALAIRQDFETQFDLARYAARTNRPDEVLMYLERCIQDRPTTVITMFAEDDFCGTEDTPTLVPDMAALAAKLTGEARSRATVMVTHWRQAVEAVRRAELIAMRPIDIPKHLTTDVDRAEKMVSESDYLTALEWEQVALSYAEQTRRLAKEQVSRESQTHRKEVLKTRDMATDVLESSKSHVHASLQEQQLEIDKVSSLFVKREKPHLLANMVVLMAGIAMEYCFHSPIHSYLASPERRFADHSMPTYLYYAYLGISWAVFSFAVFIVLYFVDGSIRNTRVLAIQERYSRDTNNLADSTKEQHGELKKQALKAQEDRRRADLAMQQLDSD